MINKLNPKIVSLSLATISGILYIFCALLFIVIPQPSLGFFKNIFHGIDITKIAQSSISFGNTLLGFVEIIIAAFIIGWLFALTYNYFLARIK